MKLVFLLIYLFSNILGNAVDNGTEETRVGKLRPNAVFSEKLVKNDLEHPFLDD